VASWDAGPGLFWEGLRDDVLLGTQVSDAREPEVPVLGKKCFNGHVAQPAPAAKIEGKPQDLGLKPEAVQISL
jgi:hypothetical protein